MEALLNNPWSFGAIVAICATAILLAIMGYRFKLSRDGLSTSRGENTKPEPIMPERYARYTMQLIEHSIAHNNKLRDLWPGCLAKQMRLYEEREITVHGMLAQEFNHILYAKGTDDATAEDEMARFRAHISCALAVVKSLVREAFRNNHYYEMDDNEWIEYVKEKTRTINDVISNELSKFWRSPVVTRAELKAIGAKTSHDYEVICTELFRRARSISIEAYKDEQEEKARYNSLIAYQTGLPMEHYCR